jgi:PAS domain S-box-containing protein
MQFSRNRVHRALDRGRAVTFIEGVADNATESMLLSQVRSALCAPFFVRGQAAGCFYVTHGQVAGLFGEEEERLADFIAAIAGAALENAEGFAELRRLNEALELRIAEGKRAEKQIQEQAALLDKAQDAISVQDLEGRVLFWNRSAERLYGWSTDEACGRKANELLRSGVSGQWSVVSEEGHSFSLTTDHWPQPSAPEWAGEMRQVTRGGKEVIVESRWTLVRDDAGQPKSWLVVSTDVTEKKKLEAQFFRAQRMESIGTLAGGIAHDINNMLTPILMGVELLKTDMPSGERLSLLKDLEANALRGADMVKQVLSFARGVEGQKVTLRLKHVLVELEKMLSRTFPKSIAISKSIPPNLWSVSGDPTQLYQMMMNLSVNARDAMQSEGTLSITAANAVLKEEDARAHPDARTGPYVLLTVADTGSGIASEVLDKIFDPFFTTKEYGKGTGLGLSTVLGMVKGHGGFIQVQSEVGKGTRFLIYLPAVMSSKLSELETSPAVNAGGKKELILVVDDEAFIRDITRKNLQAHGYRVITAREGGEALALYTRYRGEVRAVLTDMMMPGMDGAATIRELRQLDPQVRIIAVSGQGVLDENGKGPAGADAFLAKPYKVEKLLATLHQVIGGQ